MQTVEAPGGGDVLTMRRHAAEQLEREAGWLRTLMSDYAGEVQAGDRARGTQRVDASGRRRQARRRLRGAIRNCQARLLAAERAIDAATEPDPQLIRAVLALRHAVVDAIDVSTAGRLRA